MSSSDHVDSPDPLTLPSSPLSTHSAARRSTTPRRSQPLSQRSTNIRSSPAKSFIMNTNAAGDASPWRIKVTVEAEPHSSPSRATGRVTRSTKVPLKISAEEETGSPSKKGRARKPTPAKKTVVETSDEDARPQRKRKGTPIRPRRKAQPAVQQDATAGESGGEAEDHVAAQVPPSPRLAATRSSTAPKMRGFTPLKRPRSKRLSQARDELDEALREAVGDETQPSSEVGNMTMAENEEFTMVSIESLQSYKSKMAGPTTTPDKTGVSVSYMASSPPRSAQYPDLTQPLEEATQAEPAAAYDAMSWKPTGPAKAASPPKQADPLEDPEPSQWGRERAAVSQQIRDANTSQVIVINDSSHIHIHSPSPDRARNSSPGNADIWAEEASRSLEEDQDVTQADQQGSTQRKERSPQLEDLFSDQIQKPPRSKIPRTWRRTSGNDFAYSDSPAHPAMQEHKKTSGSETGGSRRSSGVLTPPSTDEEVGKRRAEQEGEEADEGDSSGLTQPDGAATPFHGRVTNEKQHVGHEQRDGALGPGSEPGSASDSSGNLTSPDGDDTGMFWQSNMPQVYKRPERPRYIRDPGRNLSELLGPDTSAVDSTNSTTSTNDRTQNPVVYRSSRAAQFRERQQANAVRKQANEGKVRSSPSKGKAINSPLRKSLLKSSKIGGSPLSKSALTRALDNTNSEVVDSFQSKASDQRQLLGDVQASVKRAKYATVESEETSLSQSEDSYIDNTFPHDENTTSDDEPTQDPSQSYEEHLNLDSPQKIRVKFNDSLSLNNPTHDAQGNSSLLSPRKQYPPLFSPGQRNQAAFAVKSPPTVTLVSKKAPRPNGLTAPPTSHTNFLAKLSSTFWTAITTPQLYPPPPSFQTQQRPAYAAEPPFPPQLRTHLRSRYGVLRNSHPWTLAHMRTLHRMHNSCSSGKVDSIIPNPLTAWQTLPPLPFHLAELVGSEQTVLNGNGSGKGSEKYTFSEQDAFVVVSFKEVLVEEGIVEAMEKGEIEMLGDGTARALRGRRGGRDGGERLWKGGWGTPKQGALIEWEFVVGALGAVRREEARLQGLAFASE